MDSTIRKIGPHGEIVIPKKMRDEMGLRPGREVVISSDGHNVFIRIKRTRKDVERLFGSMDLGGRKAIEESDAVCQEYMAGMLR